MDQQKPAVVFVEGRDLLRTDGAQWSAIIGARHTDGVREALDRASENGIDIAAAGCRRNKRGVGGRSIH